MKRVVSEVRDETLAVSKALRRTLDTTFWTKPPGKPRPMGIQSEPWPLAEVLEEVAKGFWWVWLLAGGVDSRESPRVLMLFSRSIPRFELAPLL